MICLISNFFEFNIEKLELLGSTLNADLNYKNCEKILQFGVFNCKEPFLRLGQVEIRHESTSPHFNSFIVGKKVLNLFQERQWAMCECLVRNSNQIELLVQWNSTETNQRTIKTWCSSNVTIDWSFNVAEMTINWIL